MSTTLKTSHIERNYGRSYIKKEQGSGPTIFEFNDRQYVRYEDFWELQKKYNKLNQNVQNYKNSISDMLTNMSKLKKNCRPIYSSYTQYDANTNNKQKFEQTTPAQFDSLEHLHKNSADGSTNINEKYSYFYLVKKGSLFNIISL